MGYYSSKVDRHSHPKSNRNECKLLMSSLMRMVQYVHELYKEHLIEKGEAGELVKLGHVPEALELYVQQSDWPKVYIFIQAVVCVSVLQRMGKGSSIKRKENLVFDTWLDTHLFELSRSLPPLSSKVKTHGQSYYSL